FALDMKTGKDEPVTAVDIDPWTLFPHEGVVASRDGRLLLASNREAVEVCDWQANRRVLEFKNSSLCFGSACFTPDGKRLLVVRIPTLEKHIIQSGQVRVEQFPEAIELYDIARCEKIGEFDPEAHGLPRGVNALAVSPNGKTVAIAGYQSC